ncbi:MAG: flavocytochrome c [Eubacteriales bacterium]|nr:flavocytochrome c [Eubacteriales bacterium]
MNQKNKGLVSLAIMVVFTLVLIFGSNSIYKGIKNFGRKSATTMTPGTYTSTQKGFGGDITVTMECSDAFIEDVQIVGDAETPGLGAVAVAELGGKMLDEQTPNVDGVSGATVSSTAIIAAANDCLTQAGADIAAMDEYAKAHKKEVKKTAETLDTDIVIVGAGGAGMTAAIKAKQAGKEVIIIDKMPYVGGNTTKASGGMNAAGTDKQKAQAEATEDPDEKAALLDSTVENYIADTMEGGHNINDPELVKTMAEKSADAVTWLESIGAPLPVVAPTGGTVHYYLHEPEDGSAVGEYLVERYQETLDELGIEVMLETEATEIIAEDGKAVGIKANSPTKEYTINAKAVILATGGFGANFDMLSSYDSSLANAVTTNTPAATGDGIVMAEAMGADTVDMEQIQLHPTVYQENGLLVSERLRSNGAILVNKEGKRFINDLATRDTVSQAELQQPDAFAYIVYDSKYAEEKLYQKYVANELTVSADTIEGLAEAIGLEGDAAANFVATVEDWNNVCAGKKADDFGRDNGLVTLDQAPFTAIKIAPGIHHTMGGLKINTSTEVLDKSGNPIPGLFAAGEVTGGVHGGNRIGGNAVADIVVYGQIAAESAVNYIGE